MFRLFAIVLSALSCSMADAQSLDERVRELERRVEQLEKQPAVGANRPTGNSGTPRQWENWRSLRRGMTESDVRTILGEPQKVDVNPAFTLWYYDPAGGGRVEFDGRNGKVQGWSEPRR